MLPVNYVNEKDEVIGTDDIQSIIEKGFTYRIARVLLFDADGRLFLQRRGKHVMSSPDKWDQSVGGHVDAGETYEQAAKREMAEELGLRDIPLTFLFKFFYNETRLAKYKLSNRFNAVFRALYNGEKIKLQKDEVSGGEWFSPAQIDAMIEKDPDDFAVGFLETWRQYKNHIQNSNEHRKSN